MAAIWPPKSSASTPRWQTCPPHGPPATGRLTADSAIVIAAANPILRLSSRSLQPRLEFTAGMAI
jgi:hypothetical protein